jgi:hypothetical protein
LKSKVSKGVTFSKIFIFAAGILRACGWGITHMRENRLMQNARNLFHSSSRHGCFEYTHLDLLVLAVSLLELVAFFIRLALKAVLDSSCLALCGAVGHYEKLVFSEGSSTFHLNSIHTR